MKPTNFHARRSHSPLLLILIFGWIVSACGSSGEAGPPATEAAEIPAATDPAAPPESQPQAGGPFVIATEDPCSLLTKEQVEAGFGQSVSAVTPQEENIGRECEYEFSADSDLRVTFYQGAEAKNYFAVLITAAELSCDELIGAFFEVAFAPLTEKYPSADPALAELPMAELYRRYEAGLGECMYIHSTERGDVGDNVLATEAIFLNASSNVAVLGDDRVVELTYQEPLSDEVSQALQQVTDKETFYAAAEPYAQAVLQSHTEILVGLLKQMAGQ